MGKKVYNDEIAAKICEEIATSSKGLRAICAELELCYATVVTVWLKNDKHPFFSLYHAAKVMQMDFMAEEIITISDDASNDAMIIGDGENERIVPNTEFIARSKLRTDNRRWLMSKLNTKYADKTQQEHSGELNVKNVTFK